MFGENSESHTNTRHKTRVEKNTELNKLPETDKPSEGRKPGFGRAPIFPNSEPWWHLWEECPKRRSVYWAKPSRRRNWRARHAKDHLLSSEIKRQPCLARAAWRKQRQNTHRGKVTGFQWGKKGEWTDTSPIKNTHLLSRFYNHSHFASPQCTWPTHHSNMQVSLGGLVTCRRLALTIQSRAIDIRQWKTCVFHLFLSLSCPFFQFATIAKEKRTIGVVC